MDTTSARSHQSVMDQVNSVIHQYLKRYGTLEGMKNDVFIDPMYYQHWTAAVKAPYGDKVRPPEIDLFLNDIHEGFSYVQQLLSSTVPSDRNQNITNLSGIMHQPRTLTLPSSLSEIPLEDPSAFNFGEQEDDEGYDNEEEYDDEEEYEEDQRAALPITDRESVPVIKPFSAMSVDDQIAVRAATTCQVLEQFVGSSLMSGLEFVPTRVVQLLPGLLEGRPAAQSEDFNNAVWCLTQMMAYLGIQSIDAELSVVSFDDHGNPVRYRMQEANFPIGELYAKWR